MVLSLSNRLSLMTNHMDAWITTFGISVGVLVIHRAFSLSALLLLFSLTAGYWLAFAINDYFDADIDQKDSKKRVRNFFSQNRLTPLQAMIGFALAALIIAPGFLQFGWRGFWVALLSVVVMWAYSAPPFRIKTRPGLDLLIHACFVETFPYAMILFLLALPAGRLDYVLIGLGLFASTTAQLEQQIRDVELDRLEKGRTFTLWVGESNALILLKALTALMIVYGFYFFFEGTIPLIVLPIGLFALPAVLLRFVRRPNEPRPERLIRTLIIGVLIYTFGLATYYLIAFWGRT